MEVGFRAVRRDPIAAGRRIYSLICVACHDPDPNKDRVGGTFGPPVAGSSLELVRMLMLDNKYPEGYQPKRSTRFHTPFPFLEGQLRDLHAFLTEAARKDG